MLVKEIVLSSSGESTSPLSNLYTNETLKSRRLSISG